MSSGICEDLPATSPKKRKLRHPRTAKACAFCRRRKVRCSGTHPCESCAKEGVRCDFEDDLVRPPPTQDSTFDAGASFPPPFPRTSVDSSPAEGDLINPSSGVSLLYHLHDGAKAGDSIPSVSIPSASLDTYGDISQPGSGSLGAWQWPIPDDVRGLLDQYFRFATPTYRFLHRPTLQQWALELTADALLMPKAASKSACVLLACAQALLYTDNGDRYINGGHADLLRSRQYYAKAKVLLDGEPGPACLSSVQARLAMCLYLLSTFRVTECRFCFSFANTVLMSLGLHRRASTPDRLELLDVESRRRTFWCAYVLDGYLSVILGRPRLLRDEDIDQPYPRNFDDQDLVSSVSAEELPLHGDLEAFVGHIEIAKLMARNSNILYPLQTLSEEEILSRTTEMIGLVHSWKGSLPDFLKPREKTLAGQRTFERQNTVLKLAYGHLSILATRRCLLIDLDRMIDLRVKSGIQECVVGISTIINTTHELIERGGLYQAFWYTQYIAVVAISTLFVMLIQDSKTSVLGQCVQAMIPEVSLQELLKRGKACQNHLSMLSPPGSQSHRHHRLLDQLRARCEKDVAKGPRPAPSRPLTTEALHDMSGLQVFGNAHTGQDESALPAAGQQWSSLGGAASNVTPLHAGLQALPLSSERMRSRHTDGSCFAPSQPHDFNVDLNIQDMLGWDWGDLDTLGFPASSAFDDGLFVP